MLAGGLGFADHFRSINNFNYLGELLRSFCVVNRNSCPCVTCARSLCGNSFDRSAHFYSEVSNEAVIGKRKACGQTNISKVRSTFSN